MHYNDITPKYTTTYFIQPNNDIYCQNCTHAANNLTPTQFTYDPAIHACDAFCSNCDIAICETIQ